MYEVHINAHPHHMLDWDKPLREQHEKIRRLAGWTAEHETAHKAVENVDNDNLLAALEGNGDYTPAKLPLRPHGALPLSATGADIYEHIKNKMGAIDWPIDADRETREQYRKSASERASQYLLSHGIKGIKYLDANSRGTGQYDLHVMYKGKPHSDPIPMMDKAQAEHHAKEYQAKGYDTEVKPRGTHNYVVFDHNDVHIKRKYEQGGAVEGYADGGVIPHGDPRREENLAKWHRGSHPATKNPDGTPKVFYHGTLYDFSAFDPAKKNAQHRGRASAIFASPDPKLANHFASPDYPEEGDKPNVMPVHVSTKNPFDYENPIHVKNALSSLTADKDFMDFHREEFRDYIKGLSQGDWRYIEDPWVQDHIRENHDGFFAKGNGTKFVAVYNPEQIKSATGNQGTFNPSNPEITKADGGDVWDDSRIRRSGEGGQETALDFIQNAPLYKQRIEDQKQSQPQAAPAPAPQPESKPMPVIAAPPPAIIRAAEPAPPAPVQQQPQAQGQTGLFHIGTNDTDPNLTVKSAQRIIDASRTMGIDPVFLLPNQSVKKPYAETSKALQKYLDDNGIQYHMPEYEPGDPAHMSHEWINNFAKTYNNPFIAGDSNSVRLGNWGYGAKGTALVHPDSKAVLGRVGAGSKAIADELEKHVKWYQQNKKSGGSVIHRMHFEDGGDASGGDNQGSGGDATSDDDGGGMGGSEGGGGNDNAGAPSDAPVAEEKPGEVKPPPPMPLTPQNMGTNLGYDSIPNATFTPATPTALPPTTSFQQFAGGGLVDAALKKVSIKYTDTGLPLNAMEILSKIARTG